MQVGVSRVDITPTNAVRMMGYAARSQMPAPTNAAIPIHARALAMGKGRTAAVVVTIDNCILPAAIAEEIRGRVSRRTGLDGAQIALTVTHTHSAPCLTGAAPNIFAQDMTVEDQHEIEIYTRWFVDRVEESVARALDDRKPSRVEWGQGKVGFAKNRRTPGGPVDHALPVMRVTSSDGSLRALWVSYACHCTTLGGEFNQHHGDWAGVASQRMEQEHPGSIGLVSIGCGADANPEPRGSLILANRHGEELAAEAGRVASTKLQPVTDAPICQLKTIQIPFERHFTRQEWQARSTNSGIIGYHARKWLARLDRGEPPSPTLSYPVQTWRFGDQLAVVFLAGEVVVDYSLRLKSELDSSRLWINGYANSVPCYIPSRRILSEGGYEAETSLWYYDRPQRLAPETEDLIIEAVKDQLPPDWRLDAKQVESPHPKSSAAALRSFQHDARFELELVASEPLVQSPVAIDFGADGRLWVCEMFDYPSGLDGQGRPGGRVKLLTDVDGDGRFDRAEPVAEGLAYPTGLMAWDGGVIVCAAPEVLYLKPRAGGRYEQRVLLTGFATHNFQARVNGLRWGMDGWVYGSGGLFGGSIRVLGTTTSMEPPTAVATVDCTNRDFRWRPATGDFEPLAGVSQQGRTSDDFGNWFGNDNSTLLWHFAVTDRQARRNPYLAPPEARVMLNRDGNRIFPVSRTLSRFNDPHTANHLTSACGPEIYRSSGLGDEFAGNAFVCEPVHNLVRRAVLVPEGVSFAARRPDSEAHTEFLASTDNWFRPVEVRTGPDGALWVVDFYRFVLEHPRWIPPERLRELDVRAGAEMGRIYRLKPVQWGRKALSNFRKQPTPQLIRLMRSSCGPERDLVHRELLSRSMNEPVREWLAQEGSATTGTPPAGEIQRLHLMNQLGIPTLDQLGWLFQHSDPAVRRSAIVLSELATAVATNRPGMLSEGLRQLAEDPDLGVRHQLALSLGQYSDPSAGALLARLLQRDIADARLRAAVYSSVVPHAVTFWEDWRLVGIGRASEFRQAFGPLLRSFSGAGDVAVLGSVARSLVEKLASLDALAYEQYTFLEVLEGVPGLAERLTRDLGVDADSALRSLRTQASDRAVAYIGGSRPEDGQLPALRYLSLLSNRDAGRRRQFLSLVSSNLPAALREEWIRSLRNIHSPEVALDALDHWEAIPVSLRGEFLSSMLGRETWTAALLDAVADGTVRAGELTPTQRQQLRDHRNAEFSKRSKSLFPPPNLDRKAVLERYRSARSQAPNMANGGAQFQRLCASCHALRGRGVAVGPDLAPFRGKSFEDFLVAILDPSTAIEPRFVTYSVETRDGRFLTGVIREESATAVTLAMAGGAGESVLKSQVKHLVASPLSMMPEGLEQGMSIQDFADLVGWIQGAPGIFGGANAVEIESARARFMASAPSGLTRPVSSNEVLRYPGWLGRLPLFYCRQNAGQSQLVWKSAIPQPTDGLLRFRWPAAMGLISEPKGHFVLRLGGEVLLEFDVVLEDAEWSGNQGSRLRYSALEANAEDSCGILELDVDWDARRWRPGSTASFEIMGSNSGSQRWFGIYHLPGAN